MRLDKYLKVARLIKRRPLAKEVCDQGRVKVNEKVARASGSVQIGDVISIQFGQRTLTIRVEKVDESVRKEQAADLYTVIQEEKREQENKF